MVDLWSYGLNKSIGPIRSATRIVAPPDEQCHRASQHRVKQGLGPEQGVITKGVFSLEKSLESLKSRFFSRVWGFSRNSRISKFSRIQSSYPAEVLGVKFW